MAAGIVIGVLLWWVGALLFAALDADPPPCTPTSTTVCTGPVDHSTNGDEKEILPPCPTEDSPNCVWDASEQGNGRGHDVVNPPTELP